MPPGRSIVFTLDTGLSANVERLAAGADLLVSEIIDPDQALADLRASRPDIPAIASPALRKHFADQHLTAEAVSGLAQRTGVGAVVLTHNRLNASRIQQTCDNTPPDRHRLHIRATAQATPACDRGFDRSIDHGHMADRIWAKQAIGRTA